MANLLDVPFDDFLRSAKLRGRQSGLRGQRDSGIKPELRVPVRVRDLNVNALLFAGGEEDEPKWAVAQHGR